MKGDLLPWAPNLTQRDLMTHTRSTSLVRTRPLFFTLAIALVGCGDDSNSDPQEATAGDTEVDVDYTDVGTGTDGGTDSGTDGGQQAEPDPESVEMPDPDEFMFASTHVFSVDDIVGDFSGVTYADDPSILCTEGCDDNEMPLGTSTMYPIDSAFRYNVVDFVGATLRPVDGEYDEGWAGNLQNEQGEHIGLGVSTASTVTYRTLPGQGQWCTGLGGDFVKCKTAEYVTMQHALTCAERVPYLYFDPITGMPVLPEYEECRELSDDLDQDLSTLTPYQFDLDQDNIASSPDYSVILGDNPGEYKYIWGNADKRPVDVRINVHLPLPEEWATADYRVTRAELAVLHTVTNNPNDKILPEGVENESPTGRIPAYEVDEEGRWLSTVDCYEGDGDYIPAGTVLRNPPFADEEGWTEDLRDGFTNAWFTSLDRNPFEWTDEVGPRWRLLAPKFGQGLPSIEIPALNCDPGPLQHGEEFVARGDVAVTHINLLDPQGGLDEPIFATSNGFTETNSVQQLASDELTTDGLSLSDEFDLQLHIKGDRQPVRLWRVVLYLDYELIE